MSENQSQTYQFVTEGGTVATHPVEERLPALVGPSTTQEVNTLRARLIPFACWRADDMRFEFGSSFVLPGIKTEMQHLAQLIKDHPGCPLSIFGHADPVGNDDYNKQLSGRRAISIYALLTRDTALWEELYRQPAGNNDWGKKALQVMVREVDESASPSGSEEEGPDVSSYQQNSAKRKTLFADYMDRLCGPELKLTKKDFLAQGDDAGGKGDYQGCSEFNPVLIFSQQDQQRFEQDQDKTERNEKNAPNRRVMVLLFRKGSKVSPTTWPCPSVKYGVSGCKARFFSDGEQRRSTRLPDKPRKYEESKNTFACRFYDRLSNNSPCDHEIPLATGLLHMQIFDIDGRAPLAGRKYEITSAATGMKQFSGVLNKAGVVRHEFVPDGDYVLTVNGCDELSTMTVLHMSDVVPQTRYLETGALAVFVRTSEDAPVEGATVTVDKLGDKVTDADGLADYGLVNPGEYLVSARKDGFKPISLGERSALLSSSPQVDPDSTFTNRHLTVGGSKTKGLVPLQRVAVSKVMIKEITATLPGTAHKRDPAGKSLNPNILKPSKTNAATPIDHVVLVRGGGEIVLEAITDPPGQSVNWSIAKNETSAPPPGCAPEAGGTRARVKTDQAGSFSVIANRDGSTLRWNFVLVGVDVDVVNAKFNKRDSFEDFATFMKTKPNPKGFSIPSTMVGAIVGEFQFGKHAWDTEVGVKFLGGGPSGDIGIDKIKPRYLQNGTFSDERCEYSAGAIGRRDTFTSLGNILDAAGEPDPGEPGPVIGVTPKLSPMWPVCNTPGMVEVTIPNPADKSVVRIRMGDSPSTGFDSHVLKSPRDPLQDAVKIAGYVKFAVSLVTWSPDAPNMIVAHAACEWLVDWDGKVSFPGGPTNVARYTPGGAHVTVVNRWQLIASGTGGTDAMLAGFEIFGPLLTAEHNKPQSTTF